jgi:hypothetical protein
VWPLWGIHPDQSRYQDSERTEHKSNMGREKCRSVRNAVENAVSFVPAQPLPATSQDESGDDQKSLEKKKK